MNRLFSFDTQLIKDLNDSISAGFRSKFVNDAVSEKLYKNIQTVRESSGRELMVACLHKEDVPDIIKKMIKIEMGIKDE